MEILFFFHLFSLIIILLSTILKNAQNTVPMVLSIENYI